MELAYIFSKESFSYISRNRNPKKIPYISGNGTFLYFRKLHIFQETSYILDSNFLSSKYEEILENENS